MKTTYSTLVTPSPRELVDRLLPDERVGLDLILEREYDVTPHPFPFGTEPAHIDEPLLVTLVPDKKRRGYLFTLAAQLRALGVTLDDLATRRDREKAKP